MSALVGDGLGEEIARQRSADPGALSKPLRGDLDWIVMKAIEKDRTRRYQSASELSADVDCHLTSQPVVAGPPSVLYKLSKFVTRHRLGVAAGLLIALAFLSGSALAAIGFVTASQEASRANREHRDAEQILAFIPSILAGSGPFGDWRAEVFLSPRAEMPFGEVLDKAAERVGIELRDQPSARAGIRSTLGRSYLNLGLLSEAELEFRSALTTRQELSAGDDLAIANAMHDLGEALFAKADYEDAETLLREALEMRRELLGERHVDIASVIHDWAKALYRLDRSEQAKQAFNDALEMREELLGEQHLAVAQSLHEMVYVDWGHTSIVEPRLERALKIRRERLGDDHLLVADTLITLADSLTHLHGYRTGLYSEAEALLGEAVAIYRKALSENHPRLAESLFMLGAVLGYRKEYAAAEIALTEALRIRHEAFGDKHPLVAWTLDSLMWLHFEQNDNESAEPYYEEAMKIWRARDQDRRSTKLRHSRSATRRWPDEVD